MEGQRWGLVVGKMADAAMEIQQGFLKYGERGKAGTENVSGEKQEAMDVWSDGVIEKMLRESGKVSSYASEERETIVPLGGEGFSVVCDPLDGSSNIEVNLPVGTIFGVFRGEGVLKRGREMVCAGYFLYGPLTVLVLAWDDRVDEYVLSNGAWLLKNEALSFPNGKDFVVSGSREKWTYQYKKYISDCYSRGYKARNIASMVADFHRALKKGGLYSYPALRGKPQGKIRLLFEANPMSFIAERANGKGVDGNAEIMDILPEKIHQRTPVYVGSINLVELVLESHGSDI